MRYFETSRFRDYDNCATFLELAKSLEPAGFRDVTYNNDVCPSVAFGYYDEAHIEKRSRAIAYAIDARRQRYPDETPFDYAPFSGQNILWDQAARASLHDYSVMDMSV